MWSGRIRLQDQKKKPAHDETFDRLRCFLLDVNDLRNYCNMVWKQVAPVGNLSYVTASFVTYMAVQMLKQMEYTLVTDFPFLDHSYARLYNTILRYRFRRHSLPRESRARFRLQTVLQEGKNPYGNLGFGVCMPDAG